MNKKDERNAEWRGTGACWPLACAVMLLLPACETNRAYHANQQGQHWPTANSVKLKGTASPEGKQPYDLAYVEFGEEGSYWDRSQVEFAKQLIHARAHPLVVVYLHGWHHGASEKDSDVLRFKTTLGMLARAKPADNVVGVYLGWRGESLSQPPVLNSIATYYDRKSAAERLANNFDCFEAIGSTVEAAHQAGGHSVVIGHSFGGLVLERAIKGALTSAGTTGQESSLLSSLIIELNPATESVLTRQIMDAFYSRTTYDGRLKAYVSRANGTRIAGGNAPFVVSLISTNDSATGTLFHGVVALAEFSSIPRPPTGGDPGRQQDDGRARVLPPNAWARGELCITLPSRGRRVPRAPLRQMRSSPTYTRITIRIITQHHLTFRTSAPTEKPNDPNTLKLGEKGPWQSWTIEFKKNADVPYWIVQVPPDIIYNHGGIWSDNSVALIAALYRLKFPDTATRAIQAPHVPVRTLSLPVPEAVLQHQMKAQ